MSKSSKDLIENKIKNKVYCEILFKLNTKEVYLFEFEKEFNKARPTLLKQIQDLEGEKFIKRRREGRKQLFYINWIKINKEFLKFLNNRKPNFKINNRLEANQYLIFYFQEMIKEYNKNKIYITLEDLYTNTISSLFNQMLAGVPTNQEQYDYIILMESLQELIFKDDLFDDILDDMAERMGKKFPNYDKNNVFVKKYLKRLELK